MQKRKRTPVTKYIAVFEDGGVVPSSGLEVSAGLIRMRLQAREDIVAGKYEGFIVGFARGWHERLPCADRVMSRKDCEQELTLCALRSVETYDGRAKFSTWLYSNLFMVCRKAVKTAYYQRNLPSGCRIEWQPENRHTIERFLVDYRSNEHQHNRVAKLLDSMSAESRKTFDEILGCINPEGAIRSIRIRGYSKRFSTKRIRKLRTELELLGANLGV